MAVVADLSRDDVIAGLHRLENKLREQGVIQLAIFGSRARGDNRPDSDLDVLVDIAAGQKFSLLDLIGISHIISDELGVPANMFMRRSIEPEMTRTIKRDIVEIF